jgi:dihydroneopterin aldolase
MPVITLKNLSYRAPHGLHAFEKETGNEFEVDIVVETHTDLSDSDKLESTLDYSRVADLVSGVMNSSPVNLLETLVARTGSAIFREFSGVTRLEVSIRKLHPPLSQSCRWVEVREEWKR